MGDEERTAKIARLRERLFATTAQRAILMSDAQELAANIGQVRETLGNPFFYAGGNYARPENADESVANFTGYRSHEPGLRLMRRLRDADRELNTLREQLRDMELNGE